MHRRTAVAHPEPTKVESRDGRAICTLWVHPPTHPPSCPFCRTYLQRTLHELTSQDEIVIYPATYGKGLMWKICRVGLHNELFDAIIPTLFPCFLLFCYPYISLHVMLKVYHFLYYHILLVHTILHTESTDSMM